jgi:DNA-binding transcriptional LysR family regulator
MTMRLRSLDLNLLLVFEAVLHEGNIARAAKRLHLSQPATSHALARLRARLKDQLFIRTPTGMMPTPRAERLAQPVRRALDELQFALDPEVFSPATAERSFSLGFNNFGAITLTAPLVMEAQRQAPRVRLSIRPSGALDVFSLLDRGELDLVISGQEAPTERFRAQTLIVDRYVAAMRRGHPAVQKTFDLDAFAKLPRLVISSSGENVAFVDTKLAAWGQAEPAMLEAPYLSAGAILAQSDMVAVLGSRIAEAFRHAWPIVISELPFESPALKSVMIWHRRFDDQPGHRWLRDLVATVARAETLDHTQPAWRA